MHSNQSRFNHDVIERALLELADGQVRNCPTQFDLRSYKAFEQRDFAFDYERAYPTIFGTPVADAPKTQTPTPTSTPAVNDYGSYFGE